MLCYSQYHDLLGSEGPEYAPHDAFEEHEGLTPNWYNPHDQSLIDPRLRSSPSHDMCVNTYSQRSLDSRRLFTAYDPNAHGFNPRFLRVASDSVLPQPGIYDPEYQDLDHFRHLRHFSPTDPSGFTLSSNTDSSVSDYALSPDVVRSSQDVPFSYTSQGMYVTSMSMPSVTSPAWSPHASFVSPAPSTPIPTSHTVPSMRHLQVTPDPEHEDDLADDRDALHSKINLPEELEISEQLVSPPDSGPDRFVDDDDDEDETMNDDEDEETSAAVKSDSDSEFSPGTKSSPRRSSTTKRTSLRGPRHPRAILDPMARVTKSLPTQQTSSTSNQRAKSKKKPPVTKKVNSGSKNFPCTFHHYGCCATFANKNEWKRHVSSQHLQLGYYRCDMGSCLDFQRGYNDFNRKDLFTQHCRRMHAPWSANRSGHDGVSKKEKERFEKELEVIRTRCWIDRRQAPHKTTCGFCGRKFIDGKDSRSWDERMEHIGRHFERDSSKIEDESVDDGLKQWAIREGVITEGKKKGEFWLPGFEPAHPSQGSRAQRHSKRLAKEEADEARLVDSVQSEDDSEDGQEDTVKVKHLDVAMKSDDESEAEDDSSDPSDTDAEGEEE